MSAASKRLEDAITTALTANESELKPIEAEREARVFILHAATVARIALRTWGSDDAASVLKLAAELAEKAK